MVSILEAVILGIIQGITEWLPISSSAHLAIMQHFFKISDALFLDIMLHFASLFVIFVIFRKDILWVLNFKNKESRKYLGFLILATIPIGFAGYFFKDAVESALSNLLFIGIFLMITGFVLALTKLSKPREKKIGIKDSIIIGTVQAFALFPGISRSGATISSGLFLGNKRKQSARFAFLLAIPAILGATFLELFEKGFDALSMFTPSVLIGALISFVVGLIFLTLLLRVVEKGKLHYFSAYCFIMGIFSILIYFLRI